MIPQSLFATVSRSMQVLVLIGLALMIGAVTFALQNNVPVTVTFLLWRFDGSLAMVLLLAAGLGAIAVTLLSTPSVLRLQWGSARQRRQIAALELANRELQDELQHWKTGPSGEPPVPPSALSRMAPRAP
jgi:putative membrane protein